ncbi:hypothetical protein D3C81_1584110 [compost metagenome]
MAQISETAARRESGWAMSKVATTVAGGSDASAAHLMASRHRMPMAPYAPMRESFMISSTRSRVRPPPKPSHMSAKPSSWKAPVR